jgi:hypothetical protein
MRMNYSTIIAVRQTYGAMGQKRHKAGIFDRVEGSAWF